MGGGANSGGSGAIAVVVGLCRGGSSDGSCIDKGTRRRYLEPKGRAGAHYIILETAQYIDS